MTWDEIEVPREVRPFMLDQAEETKLGQKNGANTQYRYGNLHIREYDDKYLVHADKIDPRKNPLGHLVFDAPEVLVGLASAIIGVGKAASQIYKTQKNSGDARNPSLIGGFLTSVALDYLGYLLTKKIKGC